MNRTLPLLAVAPALFLTHVETAAAAPPGKPVNVRALPGSTTSIRLSWLDTASDENGFRIERGQNGVFQFVKNVGKNVQATNIVGLAANQYHQFRIRSFGPGGTSPFVVTGAYTDGQTAPGPCIPFLDVICLGLNNRFRVEGEFKLNNVVQPAGAEELNQNSGYLWFFAPDNVEAVIKILNHCNDTIPRYWVFAAGLTNVEYTITVTDTQAGRTRRYFTPAGAPPPPIQDTAAFATCP